MLAMNIKFDDDSPITALLHRLAHFDQSKLYDEMGAGLVDSVQNRFITGTDVDGNPWKMSWRASLQGGKNFSTGQTLRDTGRLMNSYTHNVLPNGVEVGTDVEYAAPLHYGAEIVPKTAGYLLFNVAGQYRKVKQVTLPPRTQLGVNADDETMLLDVVQGFMNDILRGT